MQNNNKPLTRADIHEKGTEEHIEHIKHEFQEGFDFLKKYPKSVTIFGSARKGLGDLLYAQAEEMANRIVKELSYAVLTGGGPGVMTAANKGAFDAHGASLGLNVSLPRESSANPYVTHSMKFTYFFVRKAMLAFAAEAYIFFPGGFGTFDELFSVLTLIQTKKVPRVPIIMFGSDYWDGLASFIKTSMAEKYHTIEPEDMKLFEITDSIDRVLEIIREAPVSEWWRNIN